MEVDGGHLVHLARRAEQLVVRVLVGVHRRATQRLVDGRHDLQVVLEEAGTAAQRLHLAVEGVDQTGVLVA
eukprot:scaffold5144_cov105-Isochrysis_galbana.AAC.1